MGIVFLTMTLGMRLQTVTYDVQFLVIDEPFEYNILMGRPTLNQFKAVPSTYHLRLKFPTKRGIGQVLNDIREAWECYYLSASGRITSSTGCRRIIQENLLCYFRTRGRIKAGPVHRKQPLGPGKSKDEKIKLAPEGGLCEVQILEGDSRKVMRIITDLGASTEAQLITFLHNNYDVFPWTTDDLTGIDPKVMVHNLNMDPLTSPV